MKVRLELDIADMDTSRDLWIVIKDYEDDDIKYYSGSGKFELVKEKEC